jgi:4-diphosphocytidyl-2-C-methyl-D-erythritol kinase
MAVVSENARAKINLSLHVQRRREDGFHLIESLVAFARIADRLDVEPAAQFETTVTGPFAEALADCPAEENLVVQAGHGLSHGIGGVPPGALIMLEKNLPVGAGIGGGSADAAACIRALLRLNKVKASDVALAQIASGVGSDVNVCLASEPAFITGVGNVVEPAPRLPDIPVVLVNPGLQLATPDVYEAVGLAPGEDFAAETPPRPDGAMRSVTAVVDYLNATRNDLQQPATGLAPAIADIAVALASKPGCLLARMSGSGPTCFGIFGTAAEAHDAAQWISDERPDWWVRATSLD